jgi:hypothetical protein
VRAYKFLAEDGRGVFSRFRWPLPDGEPGSWVESEVVAPCRSGIHACRPADLPYWLAPVLYEIELDGPIDEQGIKVVAERGRLIRRVDSWNDDTREAYSQMCIARARKLAAAAPAHIAEWAPAPEMAAAGPALMGFIAARIAEQLGGLDAYAGERSLQSAWLVEQLGLDECWSDGV